MKISRLPDDDRNLNVFTDAFNALGEQQQIEFISIILDGFRRRGFLA